MSKSLGNFLTIRDVLDNYHPEVLRFFIFSTQYRNPLDFSESAMQDATTGLDRLYECVASISALRNTKGDANVQSVLSQKDNDKLNSVEDRFQQAMNNDFNTAQAQGIFFDTAKTLNKIKKQLPTLPAQSDLDILVGTIELLKRLASIMGLLNEDAATYLSNKKNSLLEGLNVNEDYITDMITQRRIAKEDKNWGRCDEIRDELLEKGIILKDGAEGTTWDIKK